VEYPVHTADCMIGKWGSWPLFINVYMIVICEARGKTSYGGFLLEKVLFEVKSFYRMLSPRRSGLFSLEEHLEVQSSLLEWLSLFGRRFIVRFLL
jgi:hypothetical protein